MCHSQQRVKLGLQNIISRIPHRHLSLRISFLKVSVQPLIYLKLRTLVSGWPWTFSCDLDMKMEEETSMTHVSLSNSSNAQVQGWLTLVQTFFHAPLAAWCKDGDIGWFSIQHSGLKCYRTYFNKIQKNIFLVWRFLMVFVSLRHFLWLQDKIFSWSIQLLLCALSEKTSNTVDCCDSFSSWRKGQCRMI